MSAKPTILFLGATGGCTLTALAHALQSNYQAVALVRNPAKLTSLLQSQGLADTIISSNLHVVEGSITNVPALKTALTTAQPSGTPVAPLIISGVGGTPHLQKSFKQPVVLDQPTICVDTFKNLFAALSEIYAVTSITEFQKPTCLFISTTGVTSVQNDVPLAFHGLYHYLLSSPHKDKKQAEDLLTSSSTLRSSIVVRPSLLTGTASIECRTGLEKVRVGTEGNPAVGYTISRAEVGLWIFEEVVEAFSQGFENKEAGETCRWEGEKVTITN